jgi:hypothetical protein
MRVRRHTYTAYSIGCAVAWAVVWAIAGVRFDKDTRHELRSFFFGWVSGWTSATIARRVYPPPKPRKRRR